MNATSQSPKPIISRKMLLLFSLIADLLDIFCFGGLMPGWWSLIIDVPITIIHFLHAGPKALITLAEYVPFLGFLPCYSGAAFFLYNLNDEVDRLQAAKSSAPSSTQPPQPPLDAKPASVIDVEPVARQVVQPEPATDLEMRLQRILRLWQQGGLTEAEYQAKRQEILNCL